MNLFNTHGPCRGISLLRWGNLTMELWFCPPGYRIEEHSHPHEDIELVFLWGEALFKSTSKRKGNLSQSFYATSPHDTLKHFTVESGDVHSFVVSRKWLVFLNIARWKDGYIPTSAAKDFQVTLN